MLPPGTITYIERGFQSTIDLVFGSRQTRENIIKCDKSQEHDHDSDHMPISSEWNLQLKEKIEIPWLQFKKTDIGKLCKILSQDLCILPWLPILSETELDSQVELLIKIIVRAMNKSTPKQRLCARSMPGFDEECKELQMRAHRLKKAYHQNPLADTGKKKSLGNLRISTNKSHSNYYRCI